MKNWIREKPAESGKYWIKESKNSPAYLIFWYMDDKINFDGWWAKAEPPEWDGE